MESLVGGAFGLWIIITLCGLLRWRQIFTGIGSVLAPSWPLFAPDPIIYNYDLVFRLNRGEGNFSPWKHLLTSYSRAWYHVLWNPGFDEQIFLFRLCQALVELEGTDRRIQRLRARAHDFLRSLIATRVGEQPGTIEFLILCRRPLAPDSVEVVYLSGDEVGARVS
jgi:hypothetical protein